MSRPIIAIVAIIAALAFAGCGKNADQDGNGKQGESAVRKAGPPPQTAAPPVDKLAANPADSPAMAEAKKTFKMQCAQCHGESGRGDGMAAAQLNPKPRNYTDKTWQASVSDEEIRNIIVQRGALTGKSPLMPANPALEKKPEVLDALVQLIRSFPE